MPKKKVDNLQGFRIELQQSERDLLTNYAMGKTITNGLGALAPIGAAAIGPLVAWYLAQWTAEEFKEFLDTQVENVRDVYGEPAVEKYNQLLTIFSTKSWDDFESEPKFLAMAMETHNVLDVENPAWQDWLKNLENARIEFLVNFSAHGKPAHNGRGGFNQNNIDQAKAQGWSVATAFINFYPESDLINDIIYNRRTGGVRSLLVTMVDFFRSPFA